MIVSINLSGICWISVIVFLKNCVKIAEKWEKGRIGFLKILKNNLSRSGESKKPCLLDLYNFTKKFPRRYKIFLKYCCFVW